MLPCMGLHRTGPAHCYALWDNSICFSAGLTCSHTIQTFTCFCGTSGAFFFLLPAGTFSAITLLYHLYLYPAAAAAQDKPAAQCFIYACWHWILALHFGFHSGLLAGLHVFAVLRGMLYIPPLLWAACLCLRTLSIPYYILSILTLLPAAAGLLPLFSTPCHLQGLCGSAFLPPAYLGRLYAAMRLRQAGMHACLGFLQEDTCLRTDHYYRLKETTCHLLSCSATLCRTCHTDASLYFLPASGLSTY